MTTPVIPELRVWQRIRRYAVPVEMIDACTAARTAGDWRQACAAGRIDLAFDLAEVRREHGRQRAEQIESDLGLLAPDLLRWHLPRVLGGRTSLATGKQWILSARERRLDPAESALVLDTPKTVDGSQRLRISVEPAHAGGSWRPELPPVFWSAGHVSDLPTAYGGSAARLPGFEPGGAVRPFAAYATTVDPADPASRMEVFDRHIAAGEVGAAWAAAGVELDPNYPAGADTDLVVRGAIVPIGLAAELDRLGVTMAGIRVGWLPLARVERRPGGGIAATLVDYRAFQELAAVPPITPVACGRPADLELIRHGLLEPAELHPLVRRALFPSLPAAQRRAPDGSELRVSVPVRCRGAWHRIEHADGRLDPVSHTREEVARERLMRTLGGQVSGCFAVMQTWQGASGRLPRRLRELRRDALLRIQHGGSAALRALLDAGLDPRMADGRGGSLLHQLRAVRDVSFVRRLVDAGVPIDAANRAGRTALHVAVGDTGTPELVRALLEAGADPHARDRSGTTPAELARYKAGMDDYEEPGQEGPLREIHNLLEQWARQ